MNSNDVKTILLTGINTNIAPFLCIEASQVYKKPSCPFSTLNILTSHISEIGFDRKTSEKVTSSNPSFDYDIKNSKQEDAEMIISISSFSLIDSEASELIHELNDFFMFLGDEFFKDNGISVISVENITSIDFLIVDNYE